MRNRCRITSNLGQIAARTHLPAPSKLKRGRRRCLAILAAAAMFVAVSVSARLATAETPTPTPTPTPTTTSPTVENLNPSGSKSFSEAVGTINSGGDGTITFSNISSSGTATPNTALTLQNSATIANNTAYDFTVDFGSNGLAVASGKTLGISSSSLTFSSSVDTIHSAGDLTISECAGTITAASSSETSLSGIKAGGTLTCTNGFTGAIDVQGTNPAYGISANAVNIAEGIAKDSTITVSSESDYACGIYGANGIEGASSGNALIINGSVSATGENAYALYSSRTINVEVTSTGTLYANATETDGMSYAVRTHPVSGYYNSRIRLDAGCHVTGSIDLESGYADSLLFYAGSTSTDSTTLNGNIDGVETIISYGGNWTLNGNITGCEVFIINGGSISFNGSPSPAIIVQAEGTLSGTGTLSSLLNSGTVSPGNSIGTLTVGNYAGSSTAILRIETNAAGNCDVLNVTGTATLDHDTVSVVTTGGYKTGTKYTFLTAGTLENADTASILVDSAFLAATLGYSDTDMWFTLTSTGRNYADEAHTGNQYGVATYLDAHQAGATGDFETVLDALNLQSGSGARAAFDAMSGEIYGSLATVSIENNERFLRSITQRMQMHSMTQGLDFTRNDANNGLVYVNRLTSSWDRMSERLSGWTSWFESYGVGAGLATNGNASGLNYSTGGLTLGVERQLDECTMLGFAGGYATTNTTLQSRSDWGAIDGGQFGVYLHREYDSRYLTGIAGYGHNSFNAHRSIEFGDIDRTASSAYSGNNYSTYVELGRNLHGRYAHLQPFGALEYIGVRQEGFAETNANSIDLDVAGLNANAFRGLLGTRLLSYFRTQSDKLLTWNASAAWRHEFLDDNRVLDATFVGMTGSAFAVSGVNVDRDAAIVGTGLNYAMSNHCSAYANYDLLFSRNYAAHASLGGFQYVW